jgi:hypothetical protein
MMINSFSHNCILVSKHCSDSENLFGQMRPNTNPITMCPCVTLFVWTKIRFPTLYLCQRLTNSVKAVKFSCADHSSTTTVSTFSHTIFTVETPFSLIIQSSGCVAMGKSQLGLGLMEDFKLSL